MSIRAAVAGAAWLASNLNGWRRFRAALGHPRRQQESILRRYLSANSGTIFGHRHGFDRIRSVEDYQAAVPISGYDDHQVWIDRVASGERNVLTNEAVRRLQPTSGSTRAMKLIPSTVGLRREFSKAIAPWIVDVHRSRPGLAMGCGYWSISPVLEERTPAESSVPIGFEQDSEYLGGFARRLVESTFAVPGAVREARDIESFRYVTLLFLLARADLTIVSVWHPSFLTLLLAALPVHWHRLLKDLEHGTIEPPGALPAGARKALLARLHPRPERARRLACLGPLETGSIWPSLGLISCWGDGHAALHLDDLRRAFPGVLVQPKGLIATEAIVTVPFAGRTPLAVRSHFFEFLSNGRPRLAHELEPGGTYSLVVTTAGGLYRYRLEDRVQVTGFVGRTPSLTFLGKEDHVTDLRGEKLSETFVGTALRRVLARLEASPRFAMLAPDVDQGRAGYTLYLETDATLPSMLGANMEDELCTNPHYRCCRVLGQLEPVRIFRVAGEAYSSYVRQSASQGQRLGEIKPLSLSSQTGWSMIFPGTYTCPEKLANARLGSPTR